MRMRMRETCGIWRSVARIEEATVRAVVLQMVLGPQIDTLARATPKNVPYANTCYLLSYCMESKELRLTLALAFFGENLKCIDGAKPPPPPSTRVKFDIQPVDITRTRCVRRDRARSRSPSAMRASFSAQSSECVRM